MCSLCPVPDRRTVLRALGVAALAPTLTACEVEDYIPNFIPERQVLAMSADTWAKIRAATPLSGDTGRTEIVRGIAGQVLRAQGRDPARWDVRLFASAQVNAFALPGGRIGVFEGMFRVAENRDQLAAVIGHEIGHVDAHHPETRMNAEALRTMGLRVIQVALGLADVPFAREITAVLGAGTEFGLLLPFSRRQELQADRYGLFAMTRAGFNPEQAPKLWQRMDAMVPARGPTFLATHPAPAARIEALAAMIPEARAAARS
ncbi:MAG: M48 family metallopeptidase [Rhodospirillales bacterium]|nr:M48 family metallopeptidase [Rhodospirillales bacterium]